MVANRRLLNRANMTKGFEMQRQHGFTLIELMTTLAVAGLLASVAVPAMSSFSANAAQTSAINDLVASIHVARSAAISKNARVTVCASGDGANCESVAWSAGWIIFEDLDSDQAVDAGETILGSHAGEERLSMTSPQFGRFMTYRPNGRVMNVSVNGSAGQFTFCDDRGADKAKVVAIDLSGRPSTSTTMPNGDAPSCTS